MGRSWDWHETTSCESGALRWTRNMYPHALPDGKRVWLCVGNDGGRENSVAVWGGTNLDDIGWNFGGSCVHELDRGLEIADAIATVLESKPRVPSLVEWVDASWSDGRPAAESRYGEFHLAVDSWRKLVTNGSHAMGIYDGYEPKKNEELVYLWRWWLHLQRPGGGRPWVMKSWAAWGEKETAMAHAEQVARALAGVGFGLEEVLR